MCAVCLKSTCAAPLQGIEIRLQVNKIQSRFALTNDVGGLRLDFCPTPPREVISLLFTETV